MLIRTTLTLETIWIQVFYSTLNANGRAGVVMANSAGDARGSELEIRKKLLQSHAVDVVVSVGPNFFYTVTLPCNLWLTGRCPPLFDLTRTPWDKLPQPIPTWLTS